ncbi:hypothetical protein AVEN_115458-1 [Araneus ventricosus]|uniref:Retrovirus-related Pol polyprotein from type-1 retrotransposable element R1 n=1 Tax=Araneus ventricosus TaxID=182803 RepID=A0A4Y2NXX5_ARAVE|nr:hypothetical protein AVEN_115458-1 [Araneus ventricosus]
MPSEHLALVSLDIKSAFDTMNRPVLFKTLESYGSPAFFKNFIYFYLKNRRVFYTNDVLEISIPCSKGCPQSSVIAPTIWNIYINSILINDRPDLHIQAFADDLVLLIGGRTARELENKTNVILAAISDKLEDLELKLSIEKCQAVVYRSIASQKFSKRNSTVLNRKPTFKIKNHSIKIWVNRSNEYNTIFDINLLDKYIPFKNIPSRQKLINLDSKISNADYEICTDGSRNANETGFAVCVLKDEINIQNYLFKLNSYNSVFQAELAAIEFAVNWAVKEKVKVIIHTDSLSSISAINSANTRSEFVNKVKTNIFKAKNMVGLSWVKAHVGIPGNELAD